MASASGVIGMYKCWGDPRRRFSPSTPGGRVVDAHRRRGLDFYGQIPLGSASGVVGMHKRFGYPRRRFGPSTPGGRVADAHRRRGLDFYGHIPLWPPTYAHEWPVQAARWACTNVGGTPAVDLHHQHPVVASWTHTVGVVWTCMARYIYGHPSTHTNSQCKRRDWDAQMLGGPPPSVWTLHTRWSRRGRTP